MTEIKEIGMRIKVIRERKGVSQKDLARWIGISPSYLSQLESGERNIDAHLLAKIGESLKVSIESFFPGYDIDQVDTKKELARFEHMGKMIAVFEL